MSEATETAGAPLADVIETVGSAVVGITADGLLSTWNPAAEELYGYRTAEIVGRPLSTLRMNDGGDRGDGDAWNEAFELALAGKRSGPVTITRRHRNGSAIELSIHLGPMRSFEIPILEPGGARVPSAGLTIDDVPRWFHVLPVTVFVIDLDGRFMLVGGPALSAIGIDPDDLIGTSVFDFLDDNGREVFKRALEGQTFTVSTGVGTEIWEVTFSPLLRDGVLVGCTGCVNDVTTRWHSEEALAMHESRYRALVQHSTDVMAVMATDTTITYVSPSVTELLGYEPEEIEGTSLLDWLHPLDVQLVAGRFQRVLDRANDSFTLEVRLKHKNGSWRHYEAVHSALLDDPVVQGIIINGRDISERIENEQRLERLSLEDPLTGLPNRALLLDRASHRPHSDGVAAEPLAAAVIDLDHFRLVNDSLGHAAGDELLIELASRLRARCGPGDTVARLGADTFVVLREGVGNADAGELMALEVLESLSTPIEVSGRSVTVTASAGVAIDQGQYERAEDLISDADAAMYVAKERGRNRVEVFVESQRDQALERLQTEQALRHAIEAGELRVHYQPVVALVDGRPTGVEALVRWEHPERGLVPPGSFIPLAEETGLIVPLGVFVLREACRQVAAWNEAGLDLHVSVNLSPRQLYDRTFAPTLASVLEETGLRSSRLTLEVTESVLVDEASAVNRVLDTLCDLGVSLAIDDFGTGYSSLVTLRRLQVDTLKIDRSFVQGLGRDAEDDAIVDAVITLGKALGLRVVAEGVETDEQRSLLQRRECDDAQGYLFSRPVPADEAEQWMRARLAPPSSEGRVPVDLGASDPAVGTTHPQTVGQTV